MQTGILLSSPWNNMENKICVKCSDARAIHPILMEVKGVHPATNCSDGKIVFS